MQVSCIHHKEALILTVVPPPVFEKISSKPLINHSTKAEKYLTRADNVLVYKQGIRNPPYWIRFSSTFQQHQKMQRFIALLPVFIISFYPQVMGLGCPEDSAPNPVCVSRDPTNASDYVNPKAATVSGKAFTCEGISTDALCCKTAAAQVSPKELGQCKVCRAPSQQPKFKK